VTTHFIRVVQRSVVGKVGKMAPSSRPSKKTTSSASPIRRSSKVYEPSIDSLCNESILAELLQTPVPWTYKDLYSSQKQPPPPSQTAKQTPADNQIWKRASILDFNSSREGDRSPISTGRSTERSSASRSSQLMPKDPLPERDLASKRAVGPPPERYVVTHMLNYHRFIKDERW
jgi:hypothetical protein